MTTASDNRPPPAPHRTAGFTLMEVAIAITVVVIGVLSLFALIGKGLDSSNLAAEDTHTALFADAVFNAMRARSAVEAEMGPQAWTSYWFRVAAGTTNITLGNTNLWMYETRRPNPFSTQTITLPAAVYADGRTATQSLVNIPFHAPAITNIETVALRYRMRTTFRYTNPTDALRDNRANVSLWVWGGPFGSWHPDEAIYYYSEFENMGDL